MQPPACPNKYTVPVEALSRFCQQFFLLGPEQLLKLHQQVATLRRGATGDGARRVVQVTLLRIGSGRMLPAMAMQ